MGTDYQATIDKIDLDISHERAALRHARETCDAADARNDETAYDESKKRQTYHADRIDAMMVDRSRARYGLFAMLVDRGAFATRFQAVSDGSYFSILDTRDEREIESGIAFGSVADARAREMCWFSLHRERALKQQDRPVWDERNRAIARA
jgi:hypothetical protein